MGRIRKLLPSRPEWDFSGCPPEHLWRCFSYEYARRVPAIIAKYEAAKASRIEFDECGNWNHVLQSDDGEVVVGFCIPAGFPDVPFLEALAKARFPDYSRFRFAAIRELRKADSLRDHERQLTLALAINWRQPDKLIARDIGRLLKKKRPFAADDKRGRSERRKYEADLKALGAYRLLSSGLSAAKAITYSRRIKGKSLYVRESEWYTARQRALGVFERDFGVSS
jgi:hypothetical protein